jgi:hypothetical protein
VAISSDEEIAVVAQVNLDIGGMRFKTTVDTLTAIPESLFAMMFSGRYVLGIGVLVYTWIYRLVEKVAMSIQDVRAKDVVECLCTATPMN